MGTAARGSAEGVTSRRIPPNEAFGMRVAVAGVTAMLMSDIGNLKKRADLTPGRNRAGRHREHNREQDRL